MSRLWRFGPQSSQVPLAPCQDQVLRKERADIEVDSSLGLSYKLFVSQTSKSAGEECAKRDCRECLNWAAQILVETLGNVGANRTIVVGGGIGATVSC